MRAATAAARIGTVTNSERLARTEEALPGGRTHGAVRVGDTVRRRTQPWTPSVHALLRHLDAVGFTGAPRVLGFDDQGREMLSHLDGDTVAGRVPLPGWALADGTVRQVGDWLRGLHDATRSFVPPDGAVWFAGPPWRPGLVIGHQDAGPHNAVWRDDRLVGFIDFDTAGPTAPEFDLAFAALAWAPLHARRAIERLGFSAASADRGRRLGLLLDGYGYTGDRVALRPVVARRAQVQADVIRAGAAAGDPVSADLLDLADDLAVAAAEVSELPDSFWR